MILSDRDIKKSLQSPGGIRVDNMHEDAVGPSSVDVRLSDSFEEFVQSPYPIDPRVGLEPWATRKHNAMEVMLHPHEMILGSVFERVYVPTNMAGRVEGKSSLGRLGIVVHKTAGFIDAGNYLNITLEISNDNDARPILLVAGMWIAQITFELLTSTCDVPYDKRKGSRYLGDTTTQASRIHLNVGKIE